MFYLKHLALLTLLCLTACDLFRADTGTSESWEAEGVRATVSSPRIFYALKEFVTVEVVLENTTDQVKVLEGLKSSPTKYAFDVSIDGQWLSGFYPELQIETLTLQPHQRLEYGYTYLPSQKSHGIRIDLYLSYNQGQQQKHEIIWLYYDSGVGP